jgi:cytochrome c oxidase cbb3-type subunit 3
VGINSGHEDTRDAQMFAFGKDELLERQDVLDLVDYIRIKSSLADLPLLPRSESLFAENCASCHGENAKGDIEVGVPNLTDDGWIYGNSRTQVFQTIF